jgi:hypothetical protein
MNERHNSLLHNFATRSNLIAVILFLEVAYLSSGLINAWYTQSAGEINTWLWMVTDPPWQANASLYQIQPLWGTHYFGDLQDLLTSASWANPWGLSPTQHLPVGLAIVSIFGVFGHGLTAALFITASFLLFFGLVHVWTRGEPVSLKLVTSVTLLPLNLSALLVLDRGNLLLIAIPLLGVGIHRLLIDQKTDIGTVMCLVVAVSLKSFLLLPVLLVLFIRLENYKVFMKFLAVIGVMNLILMYSFSGPVVQNFMSFVSTTIQFANQEPTETALRTGSSFYRLTLEFFNYLPMIDPEMSLLGIMSGLVWLVLVIAVLFMKRVPLWMKIVAAFSTVQMVVTGGPYVLVWGVMAALALPTTYETKDWRSPTIAMLVTIAILINNLPIPNKLMFSPLAWTVVITSIIGFYGSPRPSRREVVSEKSR